MKNLRSTLLSVIMVLAFVGASWGAFPSTLTNAVDGVTEIFASHLNNLEGKVGVNNSSVSTSLDYMLRHSGSIDPGHKHTPPYGGTGIYSYAVGDLLYASSASALSRLAGVATGDALISGGVGAAPAWGKVALTTHISGVLPVANGGTNIASYAIGDLLYASTTGILSKLPDVAVGQVLVSGGVGVAPAWGKVGLTTHVSGILPPVNGGDGGTTASASGPVTVTTALNRQTYVATGAVEYDLPTGDLSAFVAVGAVPLKYTFVKSAAETLTIDPGAGNFIANGIAAAKLYDDVSGETWATVVLQLVSSAGSVNRWVIVGAHGTWAT